MRAPGTLYYEDRLVRCFVRRLPDGRRFTYFHGKRVGKDCPLTEEERRTYVERGAVSAVALIRNGRGITLREALGLLNAARGRRSR